MKNLETINQELLTALKKVKNLWADGKEFIFDDAELIIDKAIQKAESFGRPIKHTWMNIPLKNEGNVISILVSGDEVHLNKAGRITKRPTPSEVVTFTFNSSDQEELIMHIETKVMKLIKLNGRQRTIHVNGEQVFFNSGKTFRESVYDATVDFMNKHNIPWSLDEFMSPAEYGLSFDDFPTVAGAEKNVVRRLQNLYQKTIKS